jgi:hypothetical protein
VTARTASSWRSYAMLPIGGALLFLGVLLAARSVSAAQ